MSQTLTAPIKEAATITPSLRYDVRKPATGSNWIIVDVETVGRADAEKLLEEVEAAKNLKDPDKIKADIAEKEIERLSKLALDHNLNRIVALTMMEPCGTVSTQICQNEKDERRALLVFWATQSRLRMDRPTPLIGYNIRGFDLPTLMQRTRILGLPEPRFDFTRHSKEIVDVMELLTYYQGNFGTAIMRRTLKNFCTLMGISHDDGDCDGREVPALIEAGEFEAVKRHCEADVARTYQLAKRLGVVG